MMKKLTAVAMTAVFLIGVLVCGVFAEGFEFQELLRQTDASRMTVTWNRADLPEGTEIVFDEVLVGNVPCDVILVQDDTLVVDISELPAGTYPAVIYQYMVGDTEGSKTVTTPLIKGGTVSVLLTMTINDNGTVTVTAMDQNGIPVAGYRLDLSIGAMNVEEETDSNGTFTSLMTVEYGETASCQGKETVNGELVYAATDKLEQVRQRSTTTVPATTTTETGDTTETTAETGSTTETEPSATATTTLPTSPVNATTAPTGEGTYATIKGTGTTAQTDGKIAVNVSLDENILSLFGLKRKNFDDTARLLLSEEDYNNLAGRASNVLMLNVLTAEKEPTNAQIASAISNISKFSVYDEEHRLALTFDLSFLLLSKTDGEVIPVSALPLNSTYIVQLPVPESMKNCDMLAITMFDGDQLMTPVEVDVQNGCLRLEINSLEAYTLIGFQTGDGSNGGGNSVFLIVLLIVGILLLAGAAVLVYLFVLRKPQPKAARASANTYVPETFDENDIFSGRADFPEINRRPPADD